MRLDRRSFTQFIQASSHQFIEAEADDSNGVHGLATPCVADLLRVTVRSLLLPIGSMHDVVATVDRAGRRLRHLHPNTRAEALHRSLPRDPKSARTPLRQPQNR